MKFAMMKYALAPAVNKGEDRAIINPLIEKAKTIFFPTAKNLIGAVNF